MAYYPELPELSTSTAQMVQFRGLNRALVAQEGEMEDMTNLTSDHYPVLSTRPRRRGVANPVLADGGHTIYAHPQGMLGTDRLIVIDNGVLYVDGEEVPGLELSTDPAMEPKHMVAMGAYVCIWPDKVYVNLANFDDCGPMGATWAASDGDEISATMTRKDGRDYDAEDITVADTAPEDPRDQQLWLDASGDEDALKQYSTIYGEWITVATTYVKLQAPGIGADFREGDVVHIAGVMDDGADDTGGYVDPVTDTLTFTTDEFFLSSSFTTTHQGGTNWVSTTPTIAERTKVITVSGIPSGAVVTGAVLRFEATSSMYGAKMQTVNGKSVNAGDNEIPVEVTGNGDVSILFRFQSGNYATVSGQHAGSVTFRGIELEVTYQVAGEGGADPVAGLGAIKGDMYLYGCGEDYIIVAGLLRRNATLTPTVKVELRIPDLDYVTESNNRLWGCSFSRVDGSLTNEIRCCALGDFRNWYLFEGTSMDSYVMSIGTDGKFTGATTMLGSPIFFKESCLHKISGTEPSSFALNTTLCRGVQEGCHKSMAMVGETLYYKARAEVMAYDGAMPYPVSEKLGKVRGYDAAGAACLDKYYMCMRDKDMKWSLYVYDTMRQLWHREDDSEIHHMASMRGELYMIRENDEPTLLCVGSTAGEVEPPFEWEAKFAVFGLTDPNQKYLSRYNIRANLSAGSEMTMLLQYDSDGKWHKMGTLRTPMTRTIVLPIVPRRCDHMQLILRGKGDCKVYSISRTYENGGDGGYGPISRPANT